MSIFGNIKLYATINKCLYLARIQGGDMTKNYYKNSLKFKILEYIQQIPDNVILRTEVESMGNPRQISRCFKDLIAMGELVRIGYGIYAKAYNSEYIDAPVIKGTFGQVCKETLTKLGVAWETGSAEQAYNTGLSTQVPVRTIVQLKSRFRGHLHYGDSTLIVENRKNAK